MDSLNLRERLIGAWELVNSPDPPAAPWTGAHKGHAFFACRSNARDQTG
jgi:hypothetical protein